MLKDVASDEAVQARLASRHPFKGLGDPEDVAKAAVFLASDDASWVSGVALPVDGKPCLGVPVDCATLSLLAPRLLHCPVIDLTHSACCVYTRGIEVSVEVWILS